MDLLLANFFYIGNAIGWALIHFIWQGSLLFLTYLLITRLFLNNKIKTQYWLGMFIIAMCLIIPFREFFIQLDMTSSVTNATIHQFSSRINPIESVGILNPFDMLISLIQKFIPYLVITWMFSVLLISLHLFKSWLYLIELSKDTSIKLPEHLIYKLEQASKKLKLKFKPVISISKLIDVPATFGYFKPVILLPTSIIARLPQDQMEAILLHELCHVKRADFLHNILQLLIETLFFYHPLVKWISKDVRKVREQCCDELVLKLNNKPLVYAKALTNIASIYNSNINKKNATSPIQIAASDGELYQRIKFLMLEKRSKSQFSTIMLGFSMVVLTLITFNSFLNNKTSQTSVETFSTQSNSIFNHQEVDRPLYSIPSIQNLHNSSQSTKQKLLSVKMPVTKNIVIVQKPLTAQIEPQVSEASNKQATATKIENNTTNIINSSVETTSIKENINPVKTVLNKTKLIKNSYPKLTYKVNPIYSMKARSRGVEGTVILSFNIDKKGRVKKIAVDTSSPLKLLDGSARVALHKWRFDPRSINEHNLDNRYQQIFSFNLGDGIDQCIGGVIGTRLKSQPLCNDL